MKRNIFRTKDPAKLAAHQRAWEAYKNHPLFLLIEECFTRLAYLQTWNTKTHSLNEHLARYEAGKPQSVWREITELRNQLYATPEAAAQLSTYQALYE